MKSIKLLILFCLAIPGLALSQASLSPQQMGLGGGGVSYATGYEALFINPANLDIRERDYTIQVGLMQTGGYHESPLQISHDWDRAMNFRDELLRFRPGSNPLNDVDRENLLDRNFANNATRGDFFSSGEIYWFGAKWFRDERSYAVALRTRYANRYQVGRGYFDSSPVDDGDLEILDFSLAQNRASLHELSFGVAENFEMFTGLLPRISEFKIGIAPKIVAAGSSLELNHMESYTRPSDGETWTREQGFQRRSSGEFSRSAMQSSTFGDAEAALENSFRGRDLFSPTGIGGGIDIGITYLITFGDDFSQIRRQDERTRQSIRFSASITDLGFIHYFDDPFENRADIQSSEISSNDIPGVSDQYYSGRPGEELFFLDQTRTQQQSETPSRDSYQTLLPTAFNAGLLFQLNRIKLMGDVRLGLANDAFNTTGLSSYLGAEVRPLSFLPLRAGLRVSTDQNDYFTLGSGIETRYFDLSAGVMIRTEAGEIPLEATAASFSSLKIYF